MRKWTLCVLITLLIGALTVGGCGKKEASTEVQTPTDNPPTTQASFPTGTFKATDNDGQWVQVFKADSTFTLTRNGVALFTQGRYAPSGNRVLLSENSSICNNLGDGLYTWSFSNGSLTFAMVTDGCVSRKQTLTTNVWKKQ